MKNPVKTFFQYFLNRQLIKDLEDKHKDYLSAELQKINSYYNYINCGGCGVFAYELAKELIKKGFDCNIAWLTYAGSITEDKINQFINGLSNGTINGLFEVNQLDINCHHCYIQIGNYYIDSAGIYQVEQISDEYSGFKIITINNPFLIKPLVENDEGWNTWFERAHIPEIKKDIKKMVENLHN